ncbi:sodium-coupled monocarboxylate transporter 1-like [Tropilaelaps mercedesae]|uniref:Sodium-coupled monocarboxylate transporter 1-like n=1 Tax=Tropilaelaps mercedesae TaxID=418985 RepID=A0A1V9XTY3_9ACAR|nr:sodium-coupled monocarboxylate transporter 1-like [Tropilaelaps mercedesae]
MGLVDTLENTTAASLLSSTEAEEIVSMEDLVSRFGAWDYVVFVSMLSVSAVIGLYYACSGHKQSTTSEFLLGDRHG